MQQLRPPSLRRLVRPAATLSCAAFALLAACHPNDALLNSPTTGRYELVSVNGAPLPFITSGSGTTRTEIVDGVVDLFPSGTYAMVSHTRTVSGIGTTTTATNGTGTYNFLGGSMLSLRSSDEKETRFADVEGKRMTIVENGRTSVYLK